MEEYYPISNSDGFLHFTYNDFGKNLSDEDKKYIEHLIIERLDPAQELMFERIEIVDRCKNHSNPYTVDLVSIDDDMVEDLYIILKNLGGYSELEILGNLNNQYIHYSWNYKKD